MKTHVQAGHHYAGQVVLLPTLKMGGYKEYEECDGRILPISRYVTLYNVIYNTYGGEMGQGTFALPDLREQSPGAGLKYYMRMNGFFPAVDSDPDR